MSCNNLVAIGFYTVAQPQSCGCALEVEAVLPDYSGCWFYSGYDALLLWLLGLIVNMKPYYCGCWFYSGYDTLLLWLFGLYEAQPHSCNLCALGYFRVISSVSVWA